MLSSNPFYDQRNQERQRNRADDMVFGLLPFEGMDAVAERLINVDYLLGDAGEGLQFTGYGSHYLGVDALVNCAFLLEGGLAVKACIPDEEYLLPALEVDRHRAGVEDRERQLTPIAGIDMKPGNINQTAELGLGSNRDEGQRIGRDGDDLLGEQEGELAGRDGECLAIAELADRDRGGIGGLIVGRDIDFGPIASV